MVDRRRLLQGALLVGAVSPLAAGCRDREQPDDTTEAPPPTPAQLAELELIAAYDAAIPSAPKASRAVYTRIREEHSLHLVALGGAESAQSPAPSEAPGRKALIRAERLAVRRRTDEAEAAVADAEQAQVLALIAASEAQHVAALEQL